MSKSPLIKFTGKPRLLCGHCLGEMCENCLNVAEECEVLLSLRTQNLMEQNSEIDRLKREVELLKSERDTWKEFATLGVVKVMQQWMESEVWKRAVKPPKSEASKVLRKLERSTREWMLSNPSKTLR